MKSPRAFPLPSSTNFYALAILLIGLPALVGCGGQRKTTTTQSSTRFPTLAEKREFLERYVSFRRDYEELEFDILFDDGGVGAVPSPSYWDIRIAATVPEDGLKGWTEGLRKVEETKTSWVSKIPDAPADLGGFEWFENGNRTIGIHREKRTILYRNFSF